MRWRTAIAAALAFGGAVALYVPALSSAVDFSDAAEAQTVPYILGIGHPTGFPAYTLAGWLFAHVVALGTVAWRMNLMAALCVALSAAGIVVFATILECNAFAALFVALAFAFGSVACAEAVIANIHVFAVLAVECALMLGVKFARDGDARTLVAACACAGLGMATHPLAVLVLPGIAVAAAWQFRRTTCRTLAFAAVALLGPLLLYAYLPLRSAVVAAEHLDPTAGAPLYATGTIDWDTNQTRTVTGFLDEVLARRERAGSALGHAFDPRTIPAAFAFWSNVSKFQYGTWFGLFAAAGLGALALRDRRALSVVVAGSIVAFAFAYVYRADAEFGGYLLGPLAVLAALAAASTRLRLPRVPPAALATTATLGLGLMAVLVWEGPRQLTRPVPTTGQSVIDEVRRDVPDGAIVVAEWGEAAALGYGAAVEHALGTRTIVAGWPAQYGVHYPDWTRFRRVVIYVDAVGFPQLQAIPLGWLHRLPSASRSHLLFEIVPPG